MKADLVLALGDDVVDAGIGGDILDSGFDLLRIAGGAGDEQVESPAVSRPRRREPAGVTRSIPSKASR